MVDDRIKKIQRNITLLEKRIKKLKNVSYTSLDRDFVKREMERAEKELQYWQNQLQ